MIVLSDDDVLKLAQAGDLIADMKVAFRGDNPPPRTYLQLPGGENDTLLIMPAWKNREAVGVKILTVIPENHHRQLPTIQGIYYLMDGVSGTPIAVIGASALTVLRTAAVSGLGSKLLARSDARTLLILGTGSLAPHVIRAHVASRTIDCVWIWGRDCAKAKDVRQKLQHIAPIVEAIEDYHMVSQKADIISCATSSTHALLTGGNVSVGTHVDLIGSFTPQMREASPALFKGAKLVVDTLDGFHKSGDLIDAAAAKTIHVDTTPTIRDVISDPTLGRTADTDITILKAIGTAQTDLAAALRLTGLFTDSARSLGNIPREADTGHGPQQEF